MKLHSPEFEKALRRGVRQAVRSSAELRKECRAARQFDWRACLPLVARVGLTLFLSVVVCMMAGKSANIELSVALISLYMVGSACIYANLLLFYLFEVPDVFSLLLMPVSDDLVFKRQWQAFLWRIKFALCDYVLVFGCLAYLKNFSFAGWACSMLVAVLSWMVVMGLAAILAAFVPRKYYAVAGQILIFGMCILGAFFNKFKELVIPVIEQVSWPLNVLIPTGWPGMLFAGLVNGWNWQLGVFILLLAGVFWAAFHGLRRLQSRYEIVEATQTEGLDLVPGVAVPNPSLENPILREGHLGETEIAEIIQSRQFFAAPVWKNQGWLESWLWRWLTPREQALSEFAFLKGISIGRPWRRIFSQLLFIFVALLAVRQAGYSYHAIGIYLILILIIPGSQALHQIYQQGRFFEAVFCSGYLVPVHACRGIGYSEIGRLFFKCTAIQIPLFLLFSLGAGLVAALLLEMPFKMGCVMGGKLGMILLAARAFVLLMAFSRLSNDTVLRFYMVPLALIGCLVASCMLFVGVSIALIFVLDLRWDLLLCPLIWLSAGICWWLYGRVYRSHYFDLLGKPS